DDLFPADHAAASALALHPARNGSPARGEARFRNFAGHDVAIELDVRVHPSGSGNIVYIYDRTDVTELRQLLDGKYNFYNLVGKSPKMLALYEQVRLFAGVDWTVLIQGESGTGKELVARALHDQSPRAGKPFVAINCAGLTASLLTSQLF